MVSDPQPAAPGVHRRSLRAGSADPRPGRPPWGAPLCCAPAGLYSWGLLLDAALRRWDFRFFRLMAPSLGSWPAPTPSSATAGISGARLRFWETDRWRLACFGSWGKLRRSGVTLALGPG